MAYAISPDSGSEPGNSWQLAESLAKLGHSVTVLTQVKNRQHIPVDSTVDFIYHDIIIPIHWLRMGTASVYLHYFLWQKSVSRFLRAKKFEDFDVAHHISWGTFWLGTGLAELNVPTIFGPCGYQETHSQSLKLFGKSWKFEFLREKLLTHFFAKSQFFKKSIKNTTLCLSANRQSQKKLFEVAGKSSFLFMVEGSKISIEDFSSKINERNPQNLIWVGRFLPRKGVSLLVMAVKKLKNDFPDIRLTLVGDGPEYVNVNQLVQNLGIKEMVTFTGRVPNQEIYGLLNKHGLLVLPSLRESTGSQILEAASIGVPTVFFEFIGATTWFNDLMSYIVPIHDVISEESLVNSLADTIRKAILGSIKEYRRKSIASHNFALQNTWDKKSHDFIAFYKIAIHMHKGTN